MPNNQIKTMNFLYVCLEVTGLAYTPLQLVSIPIVASPNDVRTLPDPSPAQTLDQQILSNKYTTD